MTLNLFQRINQVRKSIGYVQKDKSVSTGGGSYKAVSHDQVTGMVRAALIEQGVIILPPSVLSATFHQKEEGSKQRLYEATYRVEFVNMDSPEDRFSVEINAHALDNGDKAPGKAMSYAAKYSILKLFNIETGEDDESRYQQEEFDILTNVDSILASANTYDLKKRFTVSYRLAEESRNKDAMKAIIAAKDRRKAELEKIEIAGQA